MSFDTAELTHDGFLDGKLKVWQPRNGYRAATDPVFLAAAVQAKPGQTVLELGCGVGVASLCLGWRLQGLKLVGLELQNNYAELARKNALENRQPLNVIEGDLTALPRKITDLAFDHVMFNPPYFGKGAFTAPTNTGKKVAHVEETPLSNWLIVAFKRLKPRGLLTVIHLAERLPDVLRGLPGDAGDIVIRPLAPREGRAAKRVIVSARKGSAGPAKLLAPFNIHDGATHQNDGDDYSVQAKAILRDGKSFDAISG